ncbi:MAG: lytic murein transglycosylase [Proteobacteria bacterium]|nr:lytic murein transglycosylase [Pseudomonadota bacterium]
MARCVSRGVVVAGLVLATTLLPAAARAATCQSGNFGDWLAAFKREAAAKGLSRSLGALDGLTYSSQVVALDRRQGVFRKSFEEFGIPRVNQRLAKARQKMQQHAATLSRIERQFGVPGSVVIAIWGLETDFGVNMGKQPALRALATLAYDCRRTAMFQAVLLDALRIVERGDLTPAQMRGAWAGELGQTQFLPSSYMKFAIDFDGDGRRDLIRSVPDVLASTANYLRGYGWTRGQGWDEGSANFEALKQWNRSSVYQKTIAYFAKSLAAR